MSNAAVAQAALVVITQIVGVHSCMAAMLLLAYVGVESTGRLACVFVAIASLIWMMELSNSPMSSQASGAYMAAALVFAFLAGLAKSEVVICAFAAIAIFIWFAELDNDDASSKLSGGYRAYQAAALLLALWAGMESTALLICLLASIGGIIWVAEAENHNNSRMPSSKLCEAYQAAALLLALGAGGQCIGLLACLVVATCSTLLIVAHSTDTNSTLGTKVHGSAPASRLSSPEPQPKAAQDSLAQAPGCGQGSINIAVLQVPSSPEAWAFVKELFTSASSVVHAAADRIKSS